MGYQNNEQRKKSLKNEIEHLKTIVEMKEKHLEHLEKNRNGNMIEVINPMFVADVTRSTSIQYDPEGFFNEAETLRLKHLKAKAKKHKLTHAKYGKRVQLPLEEVEPVPIIEEVYWNKEEFV